MYLVLVRSRRIHRSISNSIYRLKSNWKKTPSPPPPPTTAINQQIHADLLYIFGHSIMHPIHSNHSSHTLTILYTQTGFFFLRCRLFVLHSPTHSLAHLLSFQTHLFLFYHPRKKNMQKSNAKPHSDVYLFHYFFLLPHMNAIDNSAICPLSKHINLYGEKTYLIKFPNYFFVGCVQWKNTKIQFNQIQFYIYFICSFSKNCFHRHTFRRDNSTFINCFSKPCCRINANNVRRSSTDRYLLTLHLSRTTC